MRLATELLRELSKADYQSAALYSDRGRRAANKLERLMAASARLLVAQNDWASKVARSAAMQKADNDLHTGLLYPAAEGLK